MKDVIGTGFDVILFDEAHLGSTSDLSKQAVQKLMAGPHTLLVLITATYIRPIGGDPGYSVPRDHLLTWSLLDVGYARSGNMKALAEVHGKEHMQAALLLSGIAARDQVLDFTLGDLGLSAQQLRAFTRFYSSMPQLQLSRLLMEREELQAHFPVSEDGVCFRNLLALKEAENVGPQTFEHEAAVTALVTKLFDSLPRASHPPRSIDGCAAAPFTTIMAFLQCGGRDTQNVPLCNAFKAICCEQQAGSEYAYMVLSGLKLTNREGGLGATIEAAVRDAHKQGKRGLVLLTGVRGGVGLDVKEIDVVWMLTDAPSPDSWMQRAFRCLTDRPAASVTMAGGAGDSAASSSSSSRSRSRPVYLPAKQHGHVVDPYPARVLYALLEYCTEGDSSSVYNTPEQILSVLLHSKVVRVKGRKSFLHGKKVHTGSDSDESSDDSSDDDAELDEDRARDRRLSALARALSRAYCATRLATTAGTAKRMNAVQRHPLQRLQLQPQDVVLLSTSDTSAAKAMARLKAAQAGGKDNKPVGKDQAGAGPQPRPAGDASTPDDCQGNRESGDVDSESDEQLRSEDVAKTLARLAAVLTCMSHRELEAASVKPELPALLDWLHQQPDARKLRYSLARWIRWHHGYPVPVKASTPAAQKGSPGPAPDQTQADGVAGKDRQPARGSTAVDEEQDSEATVDEQLDGEATMTEQEQDSDRPSQAQEDSSDPQMSGICAAADDAWGKLTDVAQSLVTSNPAFCQDLLRFAVDLRLQLAYAIGVDAAANTTGTPGGAPAAGKQPEGAAPPAPTGLAMGPKVGIAQVINNVLELCGDDLRHSVTPLPILQAMLGKLQAAAPGLLAVEQTPAAAAAAADGQPPLAQDNGQSRPGHSTDASVANAIANGRGPDTGRKPLRCLHLGCGTGLMAAALYDTLVAAGWDSQLVLSQMLYVSEPDMTMQYLFKVVFPGFVQGVYVSAVSADTGSSSSNSSGRQQSMPQNIGAVEVSAIPPQASALSQQFDVVLAYTPHSSGSSIISHKLACAACDMLAPKGHALVLMHNRWRASKGPKDAGQYRAVRAYLQDHLGDVWDLITPLRTLLRLSVAKNGGQQLVHLIKGGIRDAERARLGYSHVHSSKAWGACACSSQSGPGPSQPPPSATAAAAAAAAGGGGGSGGGVGDAQGFCPIAAGMSSTAAALVPALAREAIEAFDAIVHKNDISIIHRVAAFRARQAALVAASNETDGAAAAAAAGASNNSSGRLKSLLTGLCTGLPNSTGLDGVTARTSTHTVRCYLTKQAKKGSAKQADEDVEGDNAESDGRVECAEEAEGSPGVDQAINAQGEASCSAAQSQLQQQPEAPYRYIKLAAATGAAAPAITEAATGTDTAAPQGKMLARQRANKATAPQQLPSLNKFKVITTQSADRCLPRGTAAGFNYGYIRVLDRDETFAGKMWGWEFDTLQEAQHFADYLRSPLPNWIASLQKEDSKVTPALTHIPFPDVKQPWKTEQRLQQEFGLSSRELEFLNHRVEGTQQHISDKPAANDSSSMAALSTYVLQDTSCAFMAGDWDWAGYKPQVSSAPSKARSRSRGRSTRGGRGGSGRGGQGGRGGGGGGGAAGAEPAPNGARGGLGGRGAGRARKRARLGSCAGVFIDDAATESRTPLQKD